LNGPSGNFYSGNRPYFRLLSFPNLVSSLVYKKRHFQLNNKDLLMINIYKFTADSRLRQLECLCDGCQIICRFSRRRMTNVKHKLNQTVHQTNDPINFIFHDDDNITVPTAKDISRTKLLFSMIKYARFIQCMIDY